MGSATLVYIYECDTCQRTLERLNDGRHSDPVNCCITEKCRGHLSLTGTRQGVPNLTPPVIGLTDWFPRGTTLSTTPLPPVIPPAIISTFGGGGGMTLAGIE